MSDTRLDALTPEQRRLLAQRLKARREAPSDAADTSGAGGEYPLSLGQERLWVLHRMHPGSAAYNMSAAQGVEGAFGREDLEAALDEVVRRHGALRTRFEERGGAAVQVVEPHRPFRLAYDDLSALDAPARDAALRRLADLEAEAPIDLEAGPPFRLRAVRVGVEIHVLLVTIHHIVADGLSFGVLWRELSELLRARAAGEPARLPPLPVSYGEYARRQRARLTGHELEELVGWWRDELAGAPHLLPLPTDLARPIAREGGGALARVELHRGLHERVWSFAAAERATPFMVLLAAAHALLGRYAGADDLLLGTAVGGRESRDVEGLIGFFANTLAIRGDLSGDPSFRTLVERVRRATLRAFDHAEVPFDRVVEAVVPERSPGWPPLVQAVFLAHLSPPGPSVAPSGEEVPLEADPGGAKFDLTLQVEQYGGATVARAEYATDLFRRGTVERLLARYGVLLAAALADPDAPLSALSLVAPGDESWLAERERGPAAADAERSVHAVFAEQAARTPERVAVAWDGGEMSYAELDARSAALAARLVAAGVRPGEAVGLLQARGPGRVVAMLGTLRAGAAYLPLDSEYPEERLGLMLSDAGAVRVVADPELADRVPAGAAEVLELAFGADAASDAPFRDVDAGPEALAYVVYTSGSTGTPKGVAVPHRGVLRLVREGGFAELGDGERWLHLAPATFDAATLEVWAPLLNGGRLALAPPGALSPTELGAVIRRHDVTSLWLTAGLFHLVAAEEPEALAGVRQLLAGGDVLAPDGVARIRAAHPSLRLVNGYGPTENTTFTACHTVAAADGARPSLPIGRPVAGTSTYVLDGALRRVPPGVPGELCAAGEGLAWGYVGRPAATAERFVPDPYGPAGSRLYRTGDRARWHTDGVLEFLGRLDQQVKVRGFRIEPGEVEAALRAEPGVRAAVAAARGEGVGKRLLGWVVPEPGAELDPAALLRALASRLPAHMVPAAIAVVDAIPLSPNGKVDRRALPEPVLHAAGEAHVPPATPTEEIVAGIWAEVLGAARIGRGDDFFAIGGHSLLATQVTSRVRHALGAEVPLRDLFEAPTLAEFAARVEAARREAAAHPAPPLVRSEANDLPLSFAQERLWFIDRLEPGSPVYNMPFAVRMRGGLDVGALERSLGEVVRRHEALRTRFPRVDDRPVQRIEPAGEWALPMEPLGAAAGREDDALREARVEWAALPFDLLAGPVFRARLLRVADDDHLLLLGLHHVAGDGWSMGIFWRETAALYAAAVRGETLRLPPPAVRYADFAAWQRGWLSGEALDRQVEWWREHLRGAPPLLEIPTDRPRPPTQSHRGAAHAFELTPALAEGLRALARREGATLFMVLLAAWDALLARWSGQEDVVVGTPVAGRTRREVEGVIGFFVNTLAIRGDLGGDPSFRALLARVREAALGAYAHQDLPFERLVEELHPERSLAHAPVFQAMLVLQNLPEEPMEPLPGLAVSGEESGAAVAKVDLSAGFMATPEGGLGAALEYAADLWEPETAARMATHLVRLLEGAVARPDAPLASLPLLSPGERAQAVAAGAATAEFPVNDTLYARFAAVAARSPGAVAVTCGDVRVTYGALRERAERIAARLRALGAGPEAVVGVALDRSPELVSTLLGVLATGAAYLPLDPAYPAERLAYMLEDAGAPVVVTRGALAERLPEDGAVHLRLEEIGEEGEVDPFAPPVGLPDSLAYVIYTSGSTGRPKGVQVTHANVLRLMDATEAWFRPGSEDVWTLFHSYAFDFSVWELWGALLHGGRLVVVPHEVARAPAELLALLVRERVTVLSQTPSAFRQLARADDDAAAAGGAPELALRAVVFGGEALDPTALRAWVERRGTEAPRLVNMYGITETTVHVTYRPIGAGDVRGAASPIGAAIPDLSLHLLDARGEPVPDGVRGELHVGGAGVARGYLGRPALTAERFVPDPFGARRGARLYRSGDLARRLPDGGLDYQGRADDQVKVRGFRIEPGEVEAALLAHPAVREAVVLPRGTGDAARLVAWTVAEEEVSAAELRRHLRGLLPEHMIPAAFVTLDALPLTRNGKVDRRALPDPEDASGETEYLPPRTPTEEVLAGAWVELLGAARVGLLDRFFDLGGHSLLATRLVSRVRELLGVELPVRAVFERPALGELAAEVDVRMREGSGPAEPPLRPVARDGDLPLSHAQERLWFVQRMEGDAPVYHMPFAYRLRGPVDAEALGRAVAETVRRHESLRTVFPLVDGAPVQRVLAPPPGVLRVHDLSGQAEEERERTAAELARAHAEDPFDLERGPLFRASLLRLAREEHHLLLNLHHVVADGWSTGVLLDELSALYDSLAAGGPSPLADPELQYADFAAWQREWLEAGAMERQLAYWRERLAGAPPLLDLPTDRPRPPVPRHRGAAESAVLEGGDAEALRGLARREGATLFMVLLAALDVVLARWSGQREVVVGTPVAGRTRAETERMIGLFLNSLALRVDLGGSPTFRELLGRVREATLGAYAHQDVPFERVLEEVRPERSLGHTPVFQVMLNLANFGEGTLRLGAAEAAELGSGGALASKFDLTLYAGETAAGGVYLHLVYDADLFDAPRMREMLGQLVDVLAAAAEAPERPAAALSLRGACEALPDPAAPLPVERWSGGVAERVAERARAEPAAVALEGPRERWTYAEVDAAADRVAAALTADGVRAGETVAVWAHRSAPLPVALLGAWRAGAAFVVLDPAYPAARLAATVRAARPAALLRVDGAPAVPDDVRAALGDAAARERIVGRGTLDGPAPAGADRVRPATEPDAVAYLAFTSGTTGAPRGIVGTHRPLAHFLGWHAAEQGIGAADRVSVLGGLAHDPLLRDLFASLWSGGTAVFPDPEEMGTPGYLAEWMRDASVTVAHLTPATGELVAANAGGARVPSLRLACFGGDRLRAADVRAFRAVAPAARVFNVYGATETPQVAALHEVSDDVPDGALPVGRGIEGVQLLVLAPSGDPAGVGELGEVAVRTPYLAVGYLDDAAATASRYRPAPWSGDPADRLYLTGDLGRYRTDGSVQLAGRADRQVKVRGYRIEPAEVESALRGLPGLEEAVVDARGTNDDRRLVAWVTGTVSEPAALRAMLRTLLPEYAIPGAFVALDALPLTPNGKVDRAALPDPDAPRADVPVPPATPTERALAEVWRALLRREAIAANDDFFALGGHSLLATRLLARVRAATGVELPLRAVFEHPVLAHFAAEVDRRAGAVGDSLPPLGPAARGDTAPASLQQERMWFVDRLEGGGAVYHMPSAHHFAGELDAGALGRALDALAARHEALRTALPEGPGGLPLQRVLPPSPVPLPLHDFSALADAERAEAFARRAAEHAAAPFDLERGPLFRAALVRLGAADHVLLLNLHHAVSDGWSNRLLVRELTALYEAFRAGRESPLPEPPLQYADYAIWQRRWLAASPMEGEAAFWREALAGAPPLLALPADRPRPPAPSHSGGSEALVLDAATLGAVRRLAEAEGATLFMALQAALAAVLARWGRTDDVVVGTPVAGRTRPELESVAGLFLNTLALRTRLDGAPSFRALLGRVRASTLAAFAHQELPFERVLEVVRPPRSLAHAPVFQVMLNLLEFGGEEAEAPAPEGARMSAMGAAAQLPAKFDLTLYAAPSAEGLALHLVYAADLFDAPRMRTLLEQVERVLREGAADPSREAAALAGEPPAGTAAVDPEAPRVAPAPSAAPSAVERAVAAAWGEVLGIAPDEIAPGADFFDLGGHSLRATQVLARIRASLGVRLPIRAFFAAPTVRGVAAAVEAAGARPEAATPVSEAPGRGGWPAGVYPLSFAQSRLWVLMRLGAGAEYHMASALRLRGELDEWALERALEEIVRRHEPLRTRIESRGGEPVQAVQPPGPLRLRAADVAPDPNESAEEMLSRLAVEEAARPFPEGGPYFRVRLLRIAPEEHLLLWTTHHLMSDGWSAGILRAELGALYGAFSRGEPSPLPPLASTYGAQVLAEREALAGGRLEALTAWWREHLAGAPPLLELPTDRPRPAEWTGRGASLDFALAPGTAERVAAFARSRGATPFMVLLAAWAAVLARWSGEDDIVVGTPVANRASPEAEPLIGFFAGTLALRTRLDGSPSFAAVVDRVRESALAAFEHAELPFERVVEAVNPPRSLAHAPVFQVLFAFQDAAGGGAADVAGMAAEPVGRERDAAKYDLALTVAHGGEALAARLEYATDLFDAATAARMAEGLRALLDAALGEPDAPADRLPLREEGAAEGLGEWETGPFARYPQRDLHELFEAQAERTPDAVAVQDDARVLTYRALDRLASGIAGRLRASGAGAERTVAVVMERAAELPAALLAVLKAGAAYVPVDPEYPPERIAYMLRDAGARVALVQSRFLPLLPDGVEGIAVDAGDLASETPPGPPAPVGAGDDRLAYVIYTSGSTGRPKGAMNAHRGVVNRILWMQDALRLEPDDAVLQKTPSSFDVSVWEFFWPLAAGARLVMAAPGEHRDPRALTRRIEAEGITTLHFVPSMLRAWLEAGEPARCRTLRRVVCSGEALPPELVRRFREALPGVELHNLYGPTEAAVDVTHWPCPAASDPPVVPIGRPVANTRCHVLDAHGARVPPGVPGEMYLAGVQVGRGYWRRPSLTAERFVPDPFAPSPGERMYRTGDRARWRPDGTLEYLGRTDFQVKVRGFRVEPGEVEAAMAAVPGVRQAVVDARDSAGGARLVAWAELADGVDAAAVRASLAASLPEHMVPSVVVAVERIPLTPSGKADRRALPEPAAAGMQAYVLPRDATELALARIWEEVLGVGRVGAADDFFRLGGHSLQAVRMLARVRERLGADLPLAEVFRTPTVAGLAAALGRGGAPLREETVVPLREGTGTPLFLFPPAGGTVTHYAELARLLDGPAPVHALRSPGVAEGETPLESVEALAERFVDAIRAVQPAGPYRLGGWSAGGTVAFAAAARLEGAGETVELLALLDAPAPDGGVGAGPPPDRAGLLRSYAASTVTADPALLDELEAELRARPESEGVAVLSAWSSRHGAEAADDELARVARVVGVFAATAAAVRRYRPDGGVRARTLLLVAAEGVAAEGFGPDALPARWRPFLAGEVEVRVMPGAHARLVLEPAVAEVARALGEALG